MPSRGYTAFFRVCKVDQDTWLPGGVVSGVKSASVMSSVNDNTPLLQSGSIETTGVIDEGYYRIEMVAESVEPVATLLFKTDGKDFDYGVWDGSVSGRSVLAPASERKVPKGTFVPAGADGAAWCRRTLHEVIHAPIEVHGSFSVAEDVVIDLGASRLDAVWQVLDVGGWCMQIDGWGCVHILEIPTQPKLRLTKDNQDLFLPQIGSTLDTFEVPNVVIVYEGRERVEVANDDPASATSTVSRGRRIEHVESDPQRKQGETLRGYAVRRLAELSDVYESIAVKREWVPEIMPYDIIEGTIPACGLDGTFRVLEMNPEMKRGILLAETWGRRS